MAIANREISSTLYSYEEEIISRALKILERRVKCYPYIIRHQENVRAYLRLQLGTEANEIFAVLFLDNQHHVLAFEKLFQGTINVVHVHARIIIQRALTHNAAAMIIVHNHPSNNTEPSEEDKGFTTELKRLLNIINITVLDHFIVSMKKCFSFAENGLL